MEAFAGGDYRAFETLYRCHKDSLYRYLVRQVTPHQAEDLCQEIWLKVINARQGYKPVASFKTWLFTIASNRLIDFWRQQQSNREESTEIQVLESRETGNASMEPEQNLDAEQQGKKLLWMIRQLPEEQRTCFLLRHEAGLTVKQIAEITGVTQEAAKSRMRYATGRLRAGLEDAYVNR